MKNRNIPIANCIFSPTVSTAVFFIAFMVFQPRMAQGMPHYLWAAAGCLLAAIVGFLVGWGFRRSEVYNYCLRCLLGLVMLLLISIAFYMTLQDVFMMFG